MPFKGDMRLGGPHDNEANLNGTSSDFDGVLEAGTVISGPTDTSRYETDFIGQSFLMPYSTTVYADGVGGQNAVETWGLQYLPAGWVTATSVTEHTIYIQEIDQTFVVGYDNYHNIEDGTGINTATIVSQTMAADGDVIYGPFGGTGYGTTAYYDYNTDTEEYAENGLILRSAYVYASTEPNQYTVGSMAVSGSFFPDGTFLTNQPISSIEVPSGSENWYPILAYRRYEWDGGGSLIIRESGYYPYGTYITNYGDYNYRWDGYGSFYQSEYTGTSGGGGGYPSYGTLLNSSSGTNYTYIQEESNQYPNGTYDYYEYADGNGGSYTQGSTYYLEYGQVIHVSTWRSHSNETTSFNAGTYNTGRSFPYLYKSSGYGGYFEEADFTSPSIGSYYPLGTTAYSDGYTANTFNVQATEGNYWIPNGTGTYMTHYVWDGNGSIIQGPNSVGEYTSYGTPIYNEYAVRISVYDEGTMNYVYFYHDGNGSYYTGP